MEMEACYSRVHHDFGGGLGGGFGILGGLGSGFGLGCFRGGPVRLPSSLPTIFLPVSFCILLTPHLGFRECLHFLITFAVRID